MASLSSTKELSVARLPNGVAVEFLGFTTPGYIVTSLTWWGPASKPVTTPGVYEADVDGMGTVLAFRIEPAVDRLVASYFKGPIINSTKVWRFRDTNIWLLALETQQRFVTVELKPLYVGPWEDTGPIPVTGKDLFLSKQEQEEIMVS